MLKSRILAVLAATVSNPAQANIITGPASVIDGDTLDMTGTRIRLFGIDAPESAQSCTREGQPWACGKEATANLREIVASQQLDCRALGIDAYGRTLAMCRTPVFDVGQEMVRRGMAVASRDAPAEYEAATQIAQRMRFGLWRGEFQRPDEWRAANPQATAPLAQAEFRIPSPRVAPSRPVPERRYTNAFGCAIKGNHSRHGDFIYHLPGQRYYDETRPEALFCTEREAQAAGFRRAKE
ncbi:MAG: thermonuclease family protein [Erythrobacter tepidarius]